MKRLPMALAIVLTPELACAADDSYERALQLSDTLVTANRDPQPRQRSSNASSVFTRADIERLQPGSVGELLQRVPGVQVVRNGGRGSTTGLYIRGTKSAQSLVLVDGQRIASASAGGAPLEWLSIEQIERVEVLRGPRSALYGADAIGGVVQIFTRRAPTDGLQPRLRLGRDSRRGTERSLGLAGGDRTTRFNLTASADDTRGIDRTRIGQGADRDRDAYRNTALSLNASHAFGDGLEVGLSVLDQRGESEYDMGFGGAYPYNDVQLSNYSGYLAGHLADGWKSRLEMGHSENRSVERFDDSPGISPFATYRDAVAWLSNLTLGNGHGLLLGIDGYQDRLHSDTPYARDSRWNRGLILQHSFAGERFASELGMRHDSNQQFGSHTSLNGALTLHLGQHDDLILSYAEGLRAPTFNDLYWPADPWGGGNPDLRPETSRTYELQWRRQLAGGGQLETSLYRTELRDAISGWPARNVDRARIDGVEASLSQTLFGWQVALGASLLDPRDRDSGHTLERRARRTLSLDLDRRFGAFSFGVGWQAVSRSHNDAANDRAIAGYGLLGLRGRWQAHDALALDLKIDNLLDRDYTRALYDHDLDGHYQGYREEGRSALLALTWTPAL